MAKLVSKVYGDALFEAARDCGKMDEIFEEVQSIGVILEENAELQKILGNPRVMREDKEQIDVYKRQFHECQLCRTIKGCNDSGRNQ